MTNLSGKGLDLVAIKYDKRVSVLYGRCLHRGALMADGHIEGDNLICGVHGWDYRFDTGVSEYNNKEVLHKFSAFLEGDSVFLDQREISAFIKENPQPFQREQYLGSYADTHPEATEPYTAYIKELSSNGLKNIGHHGFTEAMGVDRDTLPKWEDILVFVSDMSFGALSREAKIALSKGAELASGKFGFSWEKVKKAQAAISPAAFPDLISTKDFADFASQVREQTGGIPVGFKIAASHIEADINFSFSTV